MNKSVNVVNQNTFLQQSDQVQVSQESNLELDSLGLKSDLPLYWLEERAKQIENEKNLGTFKFPELDQKTAWHQFVSTHKLSEIEKVILLLALSVNFAPESLKPIAKLAAKEDLNSISGGFVLNSTRIFYPTLRTGLFLIAGKDLTLRSQIAPNLHPRLAIFTSQIVRINALSQNSSFLDAQLLLNDQFLGALLNGEAPRLDGEVDFPVRKSKATHVLSDVVLKEKALNELEKLRKFARNMQKIWDLDHKGKIRTNYISIFSGDPGTGKSFAAEAFGNEFGLPVYKVNFAQMVSKYIGETEKNLDKVFDRFTRQPCILFFDEAESIFSKRSEVKDSHDQHANNLQSFLLQKVEEFEGIVVLATNVHNLSQYFDKAFQRRIRSIVQFDFPDYAERLPIWKNALFSPFQLEDGLAERLAKNYQLSGGSIYNVISDAVVECVDNDTSIISFELVEPALKNEFKKTSRKYEVCTDEMVSVNPVRRHGPGYENRLNF
jgi:AAA+ superfamily predicted ATPase